MDGNINQDIIRTQKATEVVDEGSIVQGQPRKRSSPRTEAHGTSPRGEQRKEHSQVRLSSSCQRNWGRGGKYGCTEGKGCFEMEGVRSEAKFC